MVFRLVDGERGVNEVDEWMRNIQVSGRVSVGRRSRGVCVTCGALGAPPLLSVQICAAGSPVILVGTHLDKVGQSDAEALLDRAKNKYKKQGIYPNLVATASVSNIQKNLVSRNGIKDLRSTIYDVACHLFVGKQDTRKYPQGGVGRAGEEGLVRPAPSPPCSSHSPVTYNAAKSEKDPEALFQQRIPKEYLTLQEHIREKLRDLKKENKAPVLSEKEFR